MRTLQDRFYAAVSKPFDLGRKRPGAKLSREEPDRTKGLTDRLADTQRQVEDLQRRSRVIVRAGASEREVALHDKARSRVRERKQRFALAQTPEGAVEMSEQGKVEEEQFVSRDSQVVVMLGRLQAWWCPVCELPLELGSEAMTFVGPSDSLSKIWPILVHSECRTGLVARGHLVHAWVGLDPGKVPNARGRLRAVAAMWAKMMKAGA